jgi:Starch-binding associating with outer membrane
MKNIKLILVLFIGTSLLLGGCSKKFEEYSKNPNLPVSVPPYLLLRGALNSIPVLPDSDEERWSQYTCRNYTYYGDNRYWTGASSLAYSVLNNLNAMEVEAKNRTGNDVNVYSALSKFLKAYIFINMSLRVGDLPMSEALKKLANQKPKYDSQKQIFIQSFQLLEDANAQLTTLINNADVSLSGDIYFLERTSGAQSPLESLKKWQKVVNTFRLRALIHLSKKDSDADLKVKQQFSDILGNPTKYPVMTSNADNLEYVYNAVNNKYPDNKESFGFDALRYNLAATWVNNFAALNDIRVMKVAEPARGLGNADTSYKSFVGAPTGMDLSTMAAGVQAGKFSLYNRKRYYDGYTAENTALLSYSEMCFNIAEAINRGWATGDAESWYTKGVKASFTFYGVNDGDNVITFQRAGAVILADYVNYTVKFSFNDYFAQSAVKYAGNNANGLNQILIQKYLAMGRNSGLEGYYQWRRTGVPAFSEGTGSSASGKIPLRFQYPSSELSTNTDNVKAALTSQFGGSDDIFAKMWILN